MKRNNFIISAFAVFLAILVFDSCSRDEKLITTPSEIVQTRTAPNTINGMLDFSSYIDFEDFIESLKNQEQDTTLVRNAFANLGINISADQSSNVTDYPVCRLTENTISGFTSLRRIEENAINSNLNSGGNAFSIIEDVYQKTALNADRSVHIGTRIFKFYENGGVAIVLNNDWTKYNWIKNSNYEDLRQVGNLLVTGVSKDNWSKFYNFGSDGRITTEKTYIDDGTTGLESPLACDFSKSLVVTNLNNGKIRVELPGGSSGGVPIDIFEWTFSDGSKATGNPLEIDCNQKSNGSVTLDVWVLDPTVPSGKRRICSGTVPYFCNCGDKNTRKDELIRTVNGETWRIQAQLWVKSKEVGCEMSYKKKNFLGIWLPASNKGVRTDISGTYKRELPNKSCLDISASGIKALGEGTFPTSISVKIPEVDKVFREVNKLNAGHRVNVKGTWFGFGIGGVPRQILN